MHSGFALHGFTDLRDKLNKIHLAPDSFSDFKAVAMEMKERRKDIPAIDKITWYYRHWRDRGDWALHGIKNKSHLPKSYIDDCSWDDWMQDDPRNPQSRKAKDEKQAERRRLREMRRQNQVQQQREPM